MILIFSIIFFEPIEQNIGLIVFTDVKKSYQCDSALCSNDAVLDENQKMCLIKYDKPYCK